MHSRPYYLHHCLFFLLFPPIFILIIRLCFHLSNLLHPNFLKCLGKIHKVLKPVEIKRESLIIGGNNSGSGIATGSTVSVVGSGATSATGGNAYNTSTTILAPNVSGTLNQCVSKMIYFYYIAPMLNVLFFRLPIKHNLCDCSSNKILLQRQSQEVSENWWWKLTIEKLLNILLYVI